MVMTRPELITALQNEVRILLHLAGKAESAMLAYRPTPGQRSIGELLVYLSFMGPTLVRYALGNPPDLAVWTVAEEAAKSVSVEQALATIAGQHDGYAQLLLEVSDAVLRSEMEGFDGQTTSRGAFIVNNVLCGCAAYRTQLFLYLKSCGRVELNSANLWNGVDVAG